MSPSPATIPSIDTEAVTDPLFIRLLGTLSAQSVCENSKDIIGNINNSVLLIRLSDFIECSSSKSILAVVLPFKIVLSLSNLHFQDAKSLVNLLQIIPHYNGYILPLPLN